MMKPRVRRAVSLLLLAVALSVTCTFLGRWQWNRHVARDAQIRLIEDNYSAAPVPLAALVVTVTWRRTGHCPRMPPGAR
jgi:cytochrome oxidase assembly protein ShyY1